MIALIFSKDFNLILYIPAFAGMTELITEIILNYNLAEVISSILSSK